MERCKLPFVVYGLLFGILKKLSPVTAATPSSRCQTPKLGVRVGLGVGVICGQGNFQIIANC